ncbi:uroporphyrinogen decarboxylase [Anaerolineales bacterium HSG6]|nr:uroporphyrinogen decarboxylase [Anaerolineales bacterium HSG6]
MKNSVIFKSGLSWQTIDKIIIGLRFRGEEQNSSSLNRKHPPSILSQADRFIRACHRQPVDTTPIWLMRQAGRYMAEYRALRERYSILELIKTPDLATEVTLQPINAFDLDAAIIFADILPILEGLGLNLEFIKGDGPVIHNPIRTADDIAALTVRPAEETLGFTLQAIRQTKQALNGKVPLIGFSGAPFTLASYAIEGGSSRNYLNAKGLMYDQPDQWHILMSKLTEAIGDYLRAQAEAGAQALQLFDSWIGSLSPADYRTYVLPYSKRAIEIARTANADIPVIHFGTGTAGMLPLIKEAGGDVIGVDWRINIDTAWQMLGDEVAVQGNLDPVILATAPIPEIERQTARILQQINKQPGHIFNLGHGILKTTPIEKVAALIDFVHTYQNSN